MHTIVCIKQVPETSNVRMDEATGTMLREGVESIVNPLDLCAVEAALQLKEAHGGRITVLSMGPKNAQKAVREALAMGCDDGVLLCDRAFAGADTHATAYVLARAVERLRPFGLVLTGVRATDGETGQVGPGLAAFLGLPLATFVSSLGGPADGALEVDRMVEDGVETLRLPLPCLLSVTNQAGFPRLPTLRGKQAAKTAELAVWGAKDVDADPALLGLKGSPTRVVKIEKPVVARRGETLDARRLGAAETARRITGWLEERNLL